MSKKDEKKELDRDQWFLPEDKEKYDMYLRGADDDEPEEAKTFQLQRELVNHRNDVIIAARSAVRSEMLQTEEQGYIESEKRLSQKAICKEIPIAIASRKFEFKLPNGPYCVDITKSGRGILLGGEGGHYASFDWYSGNKFFEVYPEEEVRSVKFLQNDTETAFATNKCMYITDKNGVILHELREHKKPLFTVFLEKNWLVVSISESGVLYYSDITDGKLVARIATKRRPTCMCYNPHNSIVAVGDVTGKVSFWIPNSEEAAATLAAHPGPVVAIDINIKGDKMVTACNVGTVRIWDLKNLQMISSKKLYGDYPITDIAFSAKDILGIARGSVVSVYHLPFDNKARPFLTHKFDVSIKTLKFVLFDDFAICGLENGIASIVVPGSGEPNLDSTVANPYATNTWRANQEVNNLLDKIPYDMITMDLEGPFKVERPIDRQKFRAETLNKHKMVRTPEEKVPGKKKQQTMNEKLQKMKDAYYQQQIEKKLEKIKQGEEGEAEEEPSGPLARFAKTKSKRET